MSRSFRGISSHSVLRYSTVFLTMVPLRLYSLLFLEIQDCLLPKEDQQLPFPWHVIGAFQHLDLVQYLVVVVFVGTQKVIVCNPKSKVIVGTVDVVKSVRFPVGSLVGAVQAFDHLLERTIFSGNSIVVGKTKDLGDVEVKGVTEFMEELLSGQRIGAVSVGNQTEVFRKLFEVPERHAQCHDAGTDPTVVRDLITDDGTFGGIHDEPDIRLDTADLDIGFIGGERAADVIVIVIHEWFYTESGSFTVVGDLLV